jgi:hypothetical protein
VNLRKLVERDEGSILLFGIGLSVAGLMIATVSINVASLWVTRNVLDGIADGAAFLLRKPLIPTLFIVMG